MDILIFGGNRFVGKLVTELFYTHGHNITLLNRSGKTPIDCEVLTCDRDNKEDLIQKLDNRLFDCVIDMCLYNERQARDTIDILRGKCKKYIFVSSVAVYADSERFPIKENFKRGKNNIFGDYGYNKLMAEYYIESSHDFPWIIARPTYIIGVNNHVYRERYYFDQILNDEPIDIEGDAQAIISFVLAKDVANTLFVLGNQQINLFNAYNICGDEFITLKGFIELIGQIIGKKPKYNTVKKMTSFKNSHCVYNNNRIKTDTDIEFTTLEKGLFNIYNEEY